MTEVQRPTSFGLKLHIPAVRQDSENDIPLTPKSWKGQLFRLVQEAPLASVVACSEPRVFPHFETNRVSQSSWTSDSTRCTDITLSRRSSVQPPFLAREGVNDNQTAVFEDSSSPSASKPEGFATTAKTKVESETPATRVRRNLESRASTEACVRRRDWLSSTSPQDSNITKQEKSEQWRSRHTLSLSIQGDSEYWEKFRYSKDYQSSLMIETICNEVFNLKPSPRYKSLMKLSQKNKDSPDMHKELLQRQLHRTSNDNGIKEGEGGGTKDGIKTVFPFPPESKREGHEEKVEGIGSAAGRFQQDGRQIERRREKTRYNSTTSSVFTTTTEGDDAEEEHLGAGDRDKLLKGFGQAFHGYLTKRETEMLLRTDGQYLIRQMWNEDGFILSFRFDGDIKNYRIICEDRDSSGTNVLNLNTFYLEDRRKGYNSLDELVRDGLITLYLDENAGSYIDLLVELAQFQRSNSLLPTSPAVVSPGSRKTSRSASFRTIPPASSSSAIGSGGGGGCAVDSNTSSGTPSITVTLAVRNSMDIALLIHYFEEEIFDGLAKCQMCSNGLWGPSRKGLRCRDCKLAIHESCIDDVKSECLPDLTTISPFSTDLTTLVKGSYSGTEGSHGPPYILTKCINEVEERGLNTEGIYRISGSVADIESLKNLFEKDRVNTDLSSCADIHAITGLIKFFLRQLPDSLITTEVFDEFTHEDAGELTMASVQSLILCLPPAHRVTLKYLLEHLSRVTQSKSDNKMNAYNVSSVLMPSIVGPANMSFNVFESCTKLVHIMITQVGNLNF